MPLSERITINPNQCGGRPCLRGLRIRVKDVLEVLAAGANRDEILEDYPLLEAGNITAALEYAARKATIRSCVSPDAVSHRRTVADRAGKMARRKGHEADHVADRQMASASDGATWDLAVQAGTVIITKDADP